MKGMTLMLIVMAASFLIAAAWNYPLIKDSVHFILDPTAGSLLNLNPVFGMLVIVFIIVLVTTIIQKYGTNQEELKKLKQEQKILQEEMKKYKNNPDKLMEFQKKQLEFIPRTFDLTTKSLVYTFVPLILFFRWFNDYFTLNLVGYKFFGFLSWFWAYLIFSIIFSSILRKVLKVV
jgi:uncharacterized membrane protein (DUF106 family)